MRVSRPDREARSFRPASSERTHHQCMKSIVLAALVATPAVLFATPAPGSVGLGETARVGRYRVTPLMVLEDSRCPMNARCVWAGRLVLRVAIRDGRQRLRRDLTLGQAGAPGILLDGVTPDRVAGSGTKVLRYRFSFSQAARAASGS